MKMKSFYVTETLYTYEISINIESTFYNVRTISHLEATATFWLKNGGQKKSNGSSFKRAKKMAKMAKWQKTAIAAEPARNRHQGNKDLEQYRTS